MSCIYLSLVCAQAKNRVIGINNQLPWHLPRDLARFKSVTLGHPIIMGRKTFESIGRVLPGRENIVVTRQKDWNHEGVFVAHDLESAIKLGNGIAQKNGKKEIMLIGGASLYSQALSLAKRIYLTNVEIETEGDAFFPKLNMDEWLEISREVFSEDEVNPIACTFLTYEKAQFQN